MTVSTYISPTAKLIIAGFFAFFNYAIYDTINKKSSRFKTWYKNIQNKSPNASALLWLIIIGGGFVFLQIFMLILSYMAKHYNGMYYGNADYEQHLIRQNWLFFFIALVPVIIGVAGLKFISRPDSPASASYLANIQLSDSAASRQFYRDCVAAGITNADTPSGKARLELYARKVGISGTAEQLAAAYEAGKRGLTADKDAAAYSKTQQEEQAKQVENTQFIETRGIQKRVEICRYNIQRLDNLIKDLNKHLNQVGRGMDSLKGKETDWAVAGGVASGIAGPAAGLATALNVQEKNRAIRENNNMIAGLTNAMIGPIFNQLSNARSEKERWEQRLDQTSMTLMEEQPAENLMKALTIDIISESTSVTGAVTVKLQGRQNKSVTIYGDVDAVVDGYIRVLVKADGRTVAQGNYVLPFEGAANFRADVICIGKSPVPTNHIIQIEPGCLWAVEKKV